MKKLQLNGITYAFPKQPVVMIFVDGGDPAYFEHGIAAGIVPNIARFVRDGYSAIAEGTVPSFTCPNNMSLITGAPPAVHGISGNFYLNEQGQAVVMTGPELLRSRTLLAEFADAGARVVPITAKDKLRLQLGKDLDLSKGNVSFAAESASACTVAENGIENVLALTGMQQPDIYSMELSLFVLEAGIRLLARDRPDLMFLSLTDYIQHKHGPGDTVADEFYRRVDDAIGRLDALGAVVAVTADHGMNDKSTADGKPNVVFLQDILHRHFGAGETKVICPITDAFVRVYLPRKSRHARGDHRAGEGLARRHDGPGRGHGMFTACSRFELPADREGDVVVIGDAGTVIGAAQAEHDLSNLADARLRSHGSVTEARVPLIINRRLAAAYAARDTAVLKSHQIFDFPINGVAA